MKINWEHKKEKLRKRFASIRSKDLNYRLGREKEFLRHLAEKLGKSEEEVLGIIIDL